jgi:hypothetical protein
MLRRLPPPAGPSRRPWYGGRNRHGRTGQGACLPEVHAVSGDCYRGEAR